MIFILLTLKVLLCPWMQRDGFIDIGVDYGPNLLPSSGDRVEDSPIPFFPDLPEDEAWEQLPDSIENGRVENRASPISIVSFGPKRFLSEVLMMLAL
jgi:hypothetical protein